jgi:DNA repair exonuclease SbcCD ATPase subunit
MHAAYPPVVEFLDAVDRINSLIADKLGPIQERLDAAGAAGPQEIAQLLQTSATDPLSLTTTEVEKQIAAIEDSVQEQSAELAELAAIQSNWPDALAATAQRLDELRELSSRATQTRMHAVQVVLAGPFPRRDDAEPGLRDQLQSITAPDPAALLSLRHRITAALRAAREEEELAEGLLDRRSELKGRLTAYQAKAARLGLGEDRDLLACNRIALGLLSRKPCDLRAVTRAISDYQQMLVDKREKTE